MSDILYAKPVIDAEINKLQSKCQEYRDSGVIPYLKVLLVGDHPASVIYTRNKKKFCEKIGAKCDILQLDKRIGEEEFLEIVEDINNDKEVHGALIQLPLPKQLSHIDTTNLINPKKDVDGFHSDNISILYRGSTRKSILAPCTPKGIMTMLDYYNYDVEGLNAIVIGRSLIVGKPMALMLSNKNATVTIAHSKTKQLERACKNADIIVTACGVPKKFTSEYFRDDKTQIVIDVGISRLDDGSLSGDCDFEKIKDQVKAITPVPKGVGPMTIFTVAQNLLHALDNYLD